MVKNRTKKRNQKKATGKKLGGAVIGKGISGIVHYPALECRNSSETPSGDYVSKLSKKESAISEFKLTEKLRALDDASTYAVYPTHMCVYDDKHNLLFSKFGGYSLESFDTYIHKLLRSKNIKQTNFDVDYFENVIAALKELKKSVHYLNANGIYHGDLSLNNMLYNEETHQILLIDFEKGGHPEDETLGVQDIIDDLEIYKQRILSKIK